MTPSLNKALVIDPSGELRDFLRFCAGRLWPKLEIVSYLWARGCPRDTFDWTGFDLVVLEHRFHNPNDRGIDWVRTLRLNPAVPPIVLVAGERTENLRIEAERAGATAVLNKDDLSPRQFAECVERALRGADEKSNSTSSDNASDSTTVTPPSPAANVKVATVEVPGFRIVQPIATTSRGWVSLATDETTQQTVVIKFVRISGDADASMLKRFNHEHAILSRSRNANVIRVFKRGLVENCAFIAMEYCGGGDLSQQIKRGIQAAEAVGYLAQMMRGLRAVHGYGILHRDIKPTNLLLREDGTLVLTDFGIERYISDNLHLTSTRTLVNDLNYVSPESIRPGEFDVRSDLYSAGVVLYHMLTGTTPFRSTAVCSMLDAHLSAPVPRLPAGSATFQPLVDGLLAKDPNERFQSADEVLDGIEWLLPENA